MNYMISASTDVGTEKETNQDSYGAKILNINQQSTAFAVLCDGMGGLARGEVASASVVKAFARWASENMPKLYIQGLNMDVIRREWNAILTEYNEKIKKYGKNLGVNLGTTVTAILLAGEDYYIVNVGDSRIYEIAENLSVMTKDHTMVAREVELGRLSAEEAAVDPRRSVLLQCVGASDVVYPDFFSGKVKKNAMYMLCSDGFRHEITEEEIYRELHPSKMTDALSMEHAQKTLIDWNKSRQERDNITVVTIRTF